MAKLAKKQQNMASRMFDANNISARSYVNSIIYS